MHPEKQEAITRLLSKLLPWKSIETAPIDGSRVIVYASRCGDLPPFITCTAYHEVAGWYVDDLRVATHFLHFHDLLPLTPKEPLS